MNISSSAFQRYVSTKPLRPQFLTLKNTRDETIAQLQHELGSLSANVTTEEVQAMVEKIFAGAQAQVEVRKNSEDFIIHIDGVTQNRFEKYCIFPFQVDNQAIVIHNNGNNWQVQSEVPAHFMHNVSSSLGDKKPQFTHLAMHLISKPADQQITTPLYKKRDLKAFAKQNDSIEFNLDALVEQINQELAATLGSIKPLTRQFFTSIQGNLKLSNIFKAKLAALGLQNPDTNQSKICELIITMNTNGFTIKNISSMLARAGSNIDKAIIALVSNELGLANLISHKIFTAQNISSMLHGAGANIDKAITRLVNNAPGLKNLISQKIFTPQNISSMLDGAGANIDKAITALVNNELGLANLISKKIFDVQNISSMLSGAGSNIDKAITALVNNAPGLANLMSHKIFTPQNISSMLSGARSNIDKAITALVNNAADLENLISKKVFTPQNISSMLSGAGSNIDQAITALANNAQGLANLMNQKIFTAQNISSMLSGAGSNIDKAITALVNNAPDLENLISKKVFTHQNISSMLSGAGSNIDQAITALANNAPGLENLINQKIFTAQNISSMLNGAGSNIDKAIAYIIKYQVKLQQMIINGNYLNNVFRLINKDGLFASGAKLQDRHQES